MWVFYSFLTAILQTVRDVVGKKASKNVDEYLMTFGIQFFGLLIMIPFVIFTGIPDIKPQFWIAVIGGMITIPLGNILYMRAVKLSPISLVVPLLAFTPIFTALLAVFSEGKFPNWLGWVGITLVVIGLYSLRLDREVMKKGLFTPFTKIKDEPGSLAMLGTTVVWSIGANLSKLLVVNSGSPIFSAFTGVLIGSVTMFLIIAWREKFKLASTFKKVKDNILDLSMLGGGVTLSNLAMYAALAQGFTPYVISIKRTNMVFSSIAGKFFFKEELSKNKVFGIILMFVGLISIIFS